MLRRCADFLANWLWAYARKSPEIYGPVYLVDLAYTPPRQLFGPMDEGRAKSYCPGREIKVPAIVRYGSRGHEVKYEWNQINMAWMKAERN